LLRLAYHEITKFLFKYNKNYIAYITSGFNSVSDIYIVDVLKRVQFNDSICVSSVITPALEWNLDKILDLFRIFFLFFLLSNQKKSILHFQKPTKFPIIQPHNFVGNTKFNILWILKKAKYWLHPIPFCSGLYLRF
jgi:hypothetical protein